MAEVADLEPDEDVQVRLLIGFAPEDVADVRLEVVSAVAAG